MERRLSRTVASGSSLTRLSFGGPCSRLTSGAPSCESSLMKRSMSCLLKKSASPERMVIAGGVSHFFLARNWVLLRLFFDFVATFFVLPGSLWGRV